LQLRGGRNRLLQFSEIPRPHSLSTPGNQIPELTASLKFCVWLISLPSSSARRTRATGQLDIVGLKYKVFDAIDGSAKADILSQRVDATAYRRNMGTSLPAGKMGVYASHLAVWQEFLSTDYEHALILEDDVVLHDDFLPSIRTALSISEHWDIIRFNCIRAKSPVTQILTGNYRVNAYLGPFTGNAAYLINRDTAEKLGAQLWPQQRALDHELNRFFDHNYRQLGLEPWSSHPEDEGISTITGTNNSLLSKPHWCKRLPYYLQKGSNYGRRFFWLLRNGMLKPLLAGPEKIEVEPDQL